ncbi:MAG: class I SAM-dependent methyltransferase [Bacteroidota bacterium]
MTKKINVKLGKLQETLLLPLWGRAVETQKTDPKLIDRMAVEIVDLIDYDFSIIAENISPISRFAWIARSLHVDRTIFEFIKIFPGAAIVNIGCGLDTTFNRIDNGRIMFYDLDLPDVIDLRKYFFTENERRKTISCSFLEKKWLSELRVKDGLLFIAAGIFYYFNEHQIKDFFTSIAGLFPGSEIFFDSASPLGVKIANEKVIKNGGMDNTAILKWGLKSAKPIEQWDRKIRVVEEYPMFKGMKEGLSLKMKYGLWMSDVLNIMSMVHIRIDN